MSLGFLSSPNIHIGSLDHKVITDLNTSAFNGNSSLPSLHQASYEMNFIPHYTPKICHLLEEGLLNHIHQPLNLRAQDLLIKKIYSITVFSTHEEAIKTQASIVLYRKNDTKNFPFVINFSLFGRSNHIRIKNLTLGTIKFDTENITYKVNEKNESFQALIKTQVIQTKNESLSDLQKTHLNIHLIDTITGEEILVSKKLTVYAPLSENRKPTSSRIQKNDLYKTHIVEMKTPFSSSTLNKDNSKLKRSDYDDKEANRTFPLQKKHKPSPTNLPPVHIEKSKDSHVNHFFNLAPDGTIPTHDFYEFSIVDCEDEIKNLFVNITPNGILRGNSF